MRTEKNIRNYAILCWIHNVRCTLHLQEFTYIFPFIYNNMKVTYSKSIYTKKCSYLQECYFSYTMSKVTRRKNEYILQSIIDD